MNNYITVTLNAVVNCGFNEAIILDYFYTELFTKSDKSNFKNDKYWVKISLSNLIGICPEYLTISKVSLALKNLLSKGIIEKLNVKNEDNGNGANWYTITEKGLEIYKIN